VPDRVLVVEDDETVRTLLRLLLEDEGLIVTEAATGAAAVEKFDRATLDRAPFDLVLLDLRLPGLSGFEVCRHIRRSSEVPVIMVTAQNDSHDIVAGLELGADDYVTKPFNDHELVARIRVQLRRRASTAPGERFVIGPLEILPDEGTVRRAGELVQLTRTEFQLLCHLARHPNRVWSRDQLLHEVWGYEHTGDGRVVDTHIARLRLKIEADQGNPQLIQTVRGLGYKMPRDTS
jgi:DNA-binding response OmpR family regulator